MNVINLEQMEKVINNINPNQLIKEIDNATISLYCFKYSYTTIRGNRKNGIKYVLSDRIDPQRDLEEIMKEWVINFNKSHPYRAISNVKFLEGSLIGLIKI